MDREEREVEQERREVIAVAHRVDRVLERRGEAEGPRRDGGVDRKGASRKGARSERRDVRAVVRVSQPAVVPRETPEVREEVVAARQGLGALEVRVPGHLRGDVRFPEIEEGHLEREDLPVDRDDRLSKEQPFVERDLVVPAAGRVDLRAERTERLGEADLDVRVDVFEVVPPWERATRDLLVDAAK